MGPVRLGMLKPGEWRYLTAEELNGLQNEAKHGTSLKNEGEDSSFHKKNFKHSSNR
jgi:hypothetical protein